MDVGMIKSSRLKKKKKGGTHWQGGLGEEWGATAEGDGGGYNQNT
jgi:hypothetical protein